MEQIIIQAISAGGDVAMIAVAVALYRLDKRVFKLELERENYVRKIN